MKNLFILLYFIPTLLFAQDKIKGNVFEITSEGIELPLFGANVIWEGSSLGTVSDKDGNFLLPYDKSYKTLVFRYVGCETKKIDVKTPSKFIKIILQPTDTLGTVIVKARKNKSISWKA